jgi:hypothetical protein
MSSLLRTRKSEYAFYATTQLPSIVLPVPIPADVRTARTLQHQLQDPSVTAVMFLRLQNKCTSIDDARIEARLSQGADSWHFAADCDAPCAIELLA